MKQSMENVALLIALSMYRGTIEAASITGEEIDSLAGFTLDDIDGIELREKLNDLKIVIVVRDFKSYDLFNTRMTVCCEDFEPLKLLENNELTEWKSGWSDKTIDAIRGEMWLEKRIKQKSGSVAPVVKESRPPTEKQIAAMRYFQSINGEHWKYEAYLSAEHPSVGNSALCKASVVIGDILEERGIQWLHYYKLPDLSKKPHLSGKQVAAMREFRNLYPASWRLVLADIWDPDHAMLYPYGMHVDTIMTLDSLKKYGSVWLESYNPKK